jgi:RNA polymerase sigma-70 factor (ECF subfamily)
MTNTEDDALVAASLSGNTKAFVELIKRYDNATRATAYATVGPNGPFEDALQEGLLKAYRSLTTYRIGTNFRGWLCRIVHNAAIDQVRQFTKVTPISDGFDFLQPPTPPIDDRVIDQLTLRNAVDALPQKQREVLMLVDVEGFDYDTTAEILNAPVGTIASRLNSARTALRLTLSESHKDDVR